MTAIFFASEFCCISQYRQDTTHWSLVNTECFCLRNCLPGPLSGHISLRRFSISKYPQPYNLQLCEEVYLHNSSFVETTFLSFCSIHIPYPHNLVFFPQPSHLVLQCIPSITPLNSKTNPQLHQRIFLLHIYAILNTHAQSSCPIFLAFQEENLDRNLPFPILSSQDGLLPRVK